MSTRRFAEGTQVPAQRSRIELEALLARYGATAFAFAQRGDEASIAFELAETCYRITVPAPDRSSPEIAHTDTGQQRTQDARDRMYEAEVRRRWRALRLVVQAKLEAVASGISTLEREFFADRVLPGGRTVFEVVRPQLEELPRGATPLLLPEAAPPDRRRAAGGPHP